MIEKYDAFISYKHAPLDNRVADAIQKGLERYVLPKKVKEATGKQKIERIFRDKAELPITSNLDDNISYALENADFLIVICSKSTKLSTWVPREIEYFLQFHPISHVLTVLAEGEPGEVIPEILLKRKVLLTDAQHAGTPVPDAEARDSRQCRRRIDDDRCGISAVEQGRDPKKLQHFTGKSPAGTDQSVGLSVACIGDNV